METGYVYKITTLQLLRTIYAFSCESETRHISTVCIIQKTKVCIDVQSILHQTIQFAFCTALISEALALISNYKCIAQSAVERTYASTVAKGYIHIHHSRFTPNG
jgi:hypothetical protein